MTYMHHHADAGIDINLESTVSFSRKYTSVEKNMTTVIITIPTICICFLLRCNVSAKLARPGENRPSLAIRTTRSTRNRRTKVTIEDVK